MNTPPDDLWSVTKYDEQIRAILLEEFETSADVEALIADIPAVIRLDFKPPWEVGKPPPGNPERVASGLPELGPVYLMFQVGDTRDVRAYVMPRTPPAASEKAWLRYTLDTNRQGATFVEAMTRAGFVKQIAAEILAFADEEADEPEPVDPPVDPGSLA